MFAVRLSWKYESSKKSLQESMRKTPEAGWMAVDKRERSRECVVDNREVVEDNSSGLDTTH